MAREDYEAVIGLEVHAELSTKTKIFCSCPTTFGAEPNTHVCPICMAMPGTLPVLNEKVVEYAVKAGLATNCEISKDSKNDRKNYYYPDLPKSYQISQFDKPLCEHGYIEIETSEGKKKIRLLRIHIEEDAGKLNHDDFGGGSLVDLNRAGVPLIEMVSEPDLRSAEEVEAYLRKLKSILEYIEVSDCKMQEGSLRADVNVSVHKPGTPFGTRTEMKNMNSFRSIVRDTVPAIFNELALHGRLYNDHEIRSMDSSFIIANGESCYEICCDGGVLELDDMFAIGSGGDAAESAYTILKGTFADNVYSDSGL